MIFDDWLNLIAKCSIPFCSLLMILPVQGATVAASDVVVMSAMPDIGT